MTPAAEALLDSNVIVAALADMHHHHDVSFRLLTVETRGRFAIAAHSYAEAYSTLTRRSGPSPFRAPPDDTWRALESVARVTALVGLTPGQTLDAIRTYAAAGGVGPRLYDLLIGQAAVHHGIPRIVTWNVAHMRGLFPTLQVVDPASLGQP